MDEADKTRDKLLSELRALRAEVEALRPETARGRAAPIGFNALPTETPARPDGGISEEVLRAYERHRLASRAAGAMVYEWDLDHKVVERQGLKELTGHEPKEAGPDGDWWLEQVHPDDKARVKRSLLDAFKSVCPYAVEYLVKKKDGSYAHVLDQGAVLPAEDGRPKRCLGQVQDVNAFKRLQHDASREVAFSKGLESAGSVGVFFADDKGAVLDANDVFLALLGCSRDDLKAGGLRWTDMTQPEDQPSDGRALAALAGGRAPAPYAKGYQRRDGSRVDVLITLVRVGETGHSGLLVDVTESRREERRLRQSEANLADFFENAAVGIQWLGADGTVLRVNKAGLEMLGYQPAEIVGRHIAEFHADRAVAADIMLRLSRGENVREIATRLLCKDGSFRDVVLDCNVLFDEKKFVHARCFLRDVSSQKAVEARLQDAARSLADTLVERDLTAQRLAAKNAVTRALAESASLAEGGRRVLEAVCESLHWRFGAFWTVDRNTQMLRCVDVWGHGAFPEFERMTREVAFSAGIGLPGRVWSSGEAAWIKDVTQDSYFARRSVAVSEGLRAAMGFPVRLGEETLGIMEFFSDEMREPDEDVLSMMAGVGSQVGQFVERWRAEDSLRESERRLRRHNEALVALATTAVSASGDLASHLRRITETASRTLEVDRVGIWFFNKDRSSIHCADLYESHEHRHSAGAELKTALFPRYFRAMDEERTVAVNDARNDPRTSEFRDGYLVPHDISSMLDAPIRVNGVLAGVVCHEQVGPAREWAPEEQHFAGSIADLVSLAIEAIERRKADEALVLARDFAESVIETSNVIIVQLDTSGLVRKFNQMAEIVTGYGKGDVLGRSWVELAAPKDSYPHLWREFSRLSKGSLPRVIESPILTRSGERRLISWVNSELREDGKFAGVMLFGTDISERRKAEEDLRRAHAELEQRVEQRTADLAKTVKVLEEQIRVRQKAEAELLASRGALRALSARLESTREEERKNLAREVHDEFGQTLTAMKVELAWMNKRAVAAEPPLRERLKSLSDLIDRSIKVVRRIATDLRPGALDDLGLVSALEWQVKDFQARTSIRCRLTVKPETLSVDPATGTVVFRVVQEALTNVMRHAEASSVSVDLSLKGRSIRLRVRDDGVGITPEQAAAEGSLGLVGMRERVILCGGKLDIRGAPRGGTTLDVTLPVTSQRAKPKEPRSKTKPK